MTHQKQTRKFLAGVAYVPSEGESFSTHLALNLHRYLAFISFLQISGGPDLYHNILIFS